MRNYVIINGVNSNTITGLAINELPPISKPPLRTLIEEIDGRDGDLITELGYGAYDKVMTIGLYHTFDIDQIIAFFNGTGTIVFSNEPDKKYNFKIIEQIDYESLIKFRTASITLHCQPFKYPLSETPIEAEYKYITETGTNITLNNTKQAKMKIDLKGNTSQASEPTPSTPVDINVVSGDNTIEICGKNLFNLKEYSSSGQGIDVSTMGTHIQFSGTATATTKYLSDYETSNFEAGTYTFSITQTFTRGMLLRFYDDNNTALRTATISSNNTSTTITLDGTEAKYRIYFNPVNNTTYSYDGYVQFEKGSTATTYEAYTGQSQLISLGVENLFDKDNTTIEMGTIETTGSFSPSTIRVRAYYIEVNEETQYTISTSNSDLSIVPYYYNSSKTFVSYDNGWKTMPFTFTTPINTKYVAFLFKNSDNTITPSSLTNMQLEKGSKANSYSPYGTTPIELCKIGTYQDYIYKEDDKWYLHKEIGKKVFKGGEDEEWYRYTYTTDVKTSMEIVGISDIEEYSSNTTIPQLISNRFKPVSQQATWAVGTMSRRTQSQTHLFFTVGANYTIETFKTWLQSNNITIYYVLATPTDTEITDTNLINQLNTILYSYNGQTNVSQSNNDEAFIMTITAETLGSGVATINNVGNIYSKPTIDIEGNGTVNVSLNNNQIFSVNVTDEVIIDSTNLEAYKPDGTLQNRQVTGNIANLKLNTGNNTMTFSGDLTKATITDYTRYL